MDHYNVNHHTYIQKTTLTFHCWLYTALLWPSANTTSSTARGQKPATHGINTIHFVSPDHWALTALRPHLPQPTCRYRLALGASRRILSRPLIASNRILLRTHIPHTIRFINASGRVMINLCTSTSSRNANYGSACLEHHSAGHVQR